MESFLYILGLDAAADVVAYLGRSDTAGYYRDQAESVRRAINAHCRREDGLYVDGPGTDALSQHCQVFALLTDTVSVQEGGTNLIRTLEHPEAFAQCSVAMALYLFRALEKIGRYDLMNDRWDLWRTMVAEHLTTCVENDTSQRSDCHAWGATILYELPAVTLGVRPAAPGFEKVSIAPVPGYLSWARGEVITPRGMIKVAWRRDENGTMDVTYECPQGIKVVDTL